MLSLFVLQQLTNELWNRWSTSKQNRKKKVGKKRWLKTSNQTILFTHRIPRNLLQNRKTPVKLLLKNVDSNRQVCGTQDVVKVHFTITYHSQCTQNMKFPFQLLKFSLSLFGGESTAKKKKTSMTRFDFFFLLTTLVNFFSTLFLEGQIKKSICWKFVQTPSDPLNYILINDLFKKYFWHLYTPTKQKFCFWLVSEKMLTNKKKVDERKMQLFTIFMSTFYWYRGSTFISCSKIWIEYRVNQNKSYFSLIQFDYILLISSY